jgi:hypothetical protein
MFYQKNINTILSGIQCFMLFLCFKLRNFVFSQFGDKKYCFGHFLKRIKTRLNAFFITTVIKR